MAKAKREPLMTHRCVFGEHALCEGTVSVRRHPCECPCHAKTATHSEPEQERYEREARASGQGWRDAWYSYANCGGNDADRGW